MTNSRGRPRHPDILTPAEWRILEHVRRDRSNPEIAVELGLSVNTVRYHVSNILAKLELRDRGALKAWGGRPSARRRWGWLGLGVARSTAARFALGGLVAVAVAISVSLANSGPVVVASEVREPLPANTPERVATEVPRSVTLIQRVASDLVQMCIVHDEDNWPRFESLPGDLPESSIAIGIPHRVSPDGCIRMLPSVELAERRAPVPASRRGDVLAMCQLWPQQIEPRLARYTVGVEPVNPNSDPYGAPHRIIDPRVDQIVFADCGGAVQDVNRFDNESTRRWLLAD